MGSATDSYLEYVRPQLDRMYLVARQYVTGLHDARDLVQETLLRAWREFSRTDGRTYSPAWIFTIMRNVAWDWGRATKRRVKLVPLLDAELTEIASPDLGEPFAEWPIIDEDRFRELLDERIVAALDSLEPTFREVVVLSVAGDLTYREIADVLQCPVGTVMSRMARARRSLRERLTAFAGGRIPAPEVRT